MSILDRYMLRLFMKIFVICGLSLFGLYIVIDMVSNLDDLMEQGDQHGSMFEVLYQYYGARAFSFLTRRAPYFQRLLRFSQSHGSANTMN